MKPPPTPSGQSPTPTGSSFDPEAMLHQMKQTLQEGLAAAAEAAHERQSQLFQQSTTPQQVTPMPLSNRHSSQVTQPTRRSRSRLRSKSPPQEDNPRSPRRSHKHHQAHHTDHSRHSPRRGRESSATLCSVSPDRHSPSYDFDREDRERERQHRARLRSRPAEPAKPPNSHPPDDTRDDVGSYPGTSSHYDQPKARLG